MRGKSAGDGVLVKGVDRTGNIQLNRIESVRLKKIMRCGGV